MSFVRATIILASLSVAPVAAAETKWGNPLGPTPCCTRYDTTERLEAEAAKGNVEAMEVLANRFLFGTGYSAANTSDADKAKAVGWYKKAAAAGSVKALKDLARYSTTGIAAPALPKDEKASFIYMKKAAELGDAHAMGLTGNALLRGKGVVADAAAARVWLEKAVAGGYGAANEHLAIIYASGIGVPVDQAKFCAYTLKSAEYEAGSPPVDREKAGAAYFIAANCAWKGLGMAKNDAKAGEFVRKAADFGYAPAKDMLAKQGK